MDSHVLSAYPRLSLTASGTDRLSSNGFRCFIRRSDGGVSYFDEAESETRPYKTGVGEGFSTVFRRFKGIDGLELECRVWAEYSTDDFLFELVPLHDSPIGEIFWPAPLENEERGSMTVLPIMQGCLIPNYWPHTFPRKWPPKMPFDTGHYSCTRGMYMQFFGQYDSRGASISIFETRYDGGYEPLCTGNSPVLVSPCWRGSLGTVRYTRRLRMRFLPAGSDYNDICKVYREYIRSIGELKTLRQKIDGTPSLEGLIGRPIVHTYIWYHIQPESGYYDREHPEKNDRRQSFSQVSDKLRALKEKGLPACCVHLDGWGRRGYDNQHPDCLPPSEQDGGWDGMRSLANTCHELGYYFGTHDQYRDYFYDADTFDESLAIHNQDGSVPTHCIWYGGKQTVLCATQAPYYVRRNFSALREHGIRLDNTYLDVFSCVELDECFSPEHPMTREDCAKARMRCFDLVTADGILASSEEGIDWAFPGLMFLHHAPFALQDSYDEGDSVGISVPLLNLVYHDCMIFPWFPQYGGFGVQAMDDGALHSILFGNATYVSLEASAEEIERSKLITAWQREVQLREMLRHEFVDGNPRRQKTIFEGGYAAEVDYDTGEYILTCP